MAVTARQWRLIVNAILFQVGWIGAVLGGDLPALILLFVILALHFGFVARVSPRLPWARELAVLIVLPAVGIAIDGALAARGVIIFRVGEIGGAGLAVPIWLACIWLMFATTIYHCLDWLGSRLALAGLAAAVTGPFSYWAGVRLGAAEFGVAAGAALLAYALIWAVLLPLTLWLADSHRGGVGCSHG